MIHYESDHFFISPRAGLPAMGLKLNLGSDLSTGVFVGMALGRDAADADLTKGLDDIDDYGTYGAFIEWAPGDLSVIAAYRQAAESGYGATLDLRVTYVAWHDERNRFSIRTDKPNVEVSWQVTGIRKDAYANLHRIQVEVEKPADERGSLLHPEAFAQPAVRGIAALRARSMPKAVQESLAAASGE